MAHLEQRPVDNHEVADYVARKRVVELSIHAYPRDGSDLQCKREITTELRVTHYRIEQWWGPVTASTLRKIAWKWRQKNEFEITSGGKSNPGISSSHGEDCNKSQVIWAKIIWRDIAEEIHSHDGICTRLKAHGIKISVQISWSVGRVRESRYSDLINAHHLYKRVLVIWFASTNRQLPDAKKVLRTWLKFSRNRLRTTICNRMAGFKQIDATR